MEQARYKDVNIFIDGKLIINGVANFAGVD